MKTASAKQSPTQNIHAYVHTYIPTYVPTSVHVCIRMHVCVYVGMYVSSYFICGEVMCLCRDVGKLIPTSYVGKLFQNYVMKLEGT